MDENYLKGKRIAIFEAHPDDLELGCGGLLTRLSKSNKIDITCFSSANNVRGNLNIEDEFWKSMKHFGTTLRTCCYNDIPTMQFFKFEDVIKDRLYYTKVHFKPDVIITTNPKAHNRDHSVLGQCVMNVFQEQTILFFEDIRGGQDHRPDVYVKLSSDEFVSKMKAISFYDTQRKQRDYFKPDKISSMALYRGSQIGEIYVETFEVGRIVI